MNRPVFEYDQAVSDQELLQIYKGWVIQYQAMPWWNLKKKVLLWCAAQTTLIIYEWLKQNKPYEVPNEK